MATKSIKAQLQAACRWAQERWKLQDWIFDIIVEDNSREIDDNEMGRITTYSDQKQARVVIQPGACGLKGETPLQVFFHEFGHLVLHEAGRAMQNQGDHAEHFCNRFAEVMVAAYPKGE